MIIEDLITTRAEPKIKLELGDTIFINSKHYKLICISKELRVHQGTILYKYKFDKTDGQKVRDGRSS